MVADAQQLAAQLHKVGVVVGICEGFVGNRLMIAREREANRLLLEGALPQQVDRVLREFGLPMGTFELADMTAGIELDFRLRQETGMVEPIVDGLVALGRVGQKADKGYYSYEPGQRKPMVDPQVTALIESVSKAQGITRRRIPDTELIDRLILPMINEGAKLLEEGVASRPGDIDVIWQRGFGWPDWKGGPMYYADGLGLNVVRDRLRVLEAAHGERFHACELLVRLANEGKSFADLQEINPH
jgi:3-hydroxyacyl-CoA dehydrogenase